MRPRAHDRGMTRNRYASERRTPVRRMRALSAVTATLKRDPVEPAAGSRIRVRRRTGKTST